MTMAKTRSLRSPCPRHQVYELHGFVEESYAVLTDFMEATDQSSKHFFKG